MFAEKTIRINNCIISYYDEGPHDGQVIIFLHGFPFNKDMWGKQINEFRTDFRVIAYDVRGHGGSDPGNTDFSVDLFVTDLIDLMDALRRSG